MDYQKQAVAEFRQRKLNPDEQILNYVDGRGKILSNSSNPQKSSGVLFLTNQRIAYYAPSVGNPFIAVPLGEISTVSVDKGMLQLGLRIASPQGSLEFKTQRKGKAGELIQKLESLRSAPPQQTQQDADAELARLERLGQLYQSGVLDEEEFQRKKKELLSNSGPRHGVVSDNGHNAPLPGAEAANRTHRAGAPDSTAQRTEWTQNLSGGSISPFSIIAILAIVFFVLPCGACITCAGLMSGDDSPDNTSSTPSAETDRPMPASEGSASREEDDDSARAEAIDQAQETVHQIEVRIWQEHSEDTEPGDRNIAVEIGDREFELDFESDENAFAAKKVISDVGQVQLSV